jgi:hypothetical protein
MANRKFGLFSPPDGASVGPNNKADRTFRELMLPIEQTGSGLTVYKSHTASLAPPFSATISAEHLKRESGLKRG